MPAESHHKLLGIEEMARKAEDFRTAGRCVVFTNGCFDLIHVGHVRYLQAARNAGDVLMVGLNSDASVRAIKGASRPVVDQAQRAEVLAALGCVDFITIFDEPDPSALIRLIKPDVLVKGADWPEDDIVGADLVKSAGGRVLRMPLSDGISTSAIIERIRKLDRTPGA